MSGEATQPHILVLKVIINQWAQALARWSSGWLNCQEVKHTNKKDAREGISKGTEAEKGGGVKEVDNLQVGELEG